MTFPSVGGPRTYAALIEDVIAGRADPALQQGTSGVDAALSRTVANAGLNDPATVDTLNRATASLFSDLGTCAGQMADTLMQLRADTATIWSDPERSMSWKTQQLLAARQKAQDALDATQTTVVKTGASIRRQVDAVLTPAASGDPAVAEMQLNSAWSVAQPFLGGSVTGDAIARLVNQGVPGMEAALRRFLPLTIMAQYAGQPQQHIDQFIESAMLQLDAAVAPTLAAASRRARVLQAQLITALGRLQTSYQLCCQEVNGTQRVSVIAGPTGPVPVVDRQLRQPS